MEPVKVGDAGPELLGVRDPDAAAPYVPRPIDDVLEDACGRDRPLVVVATNAAARNEGVKAGALVKVAAGVLGGGGGGKDDLAQGGGADATRIGDALTEIRSSIARHGA